MTLKPIVASMFLLGLASSPAWAAANSNADTQNQLDAMKAKIAKMEAVLQQNQTGGFQQTQDWFNRITVSGLINIDGRIGNRSPLGVGAYFAPYDENVIYHVNQNDKSSNDVSLSSAVVLFDAVASDWTKVHVAVAYQGEGDGANNSRFDRRNFLGRQNQPLLDEAYVTIGNFARSPFYFKAGRQNIPFGIYQKYSMTPSLTQLLTETRATAANVGFVDASGFYGSAYVFRGMPKYDSELATEGNRTSNFGLNLGYANATNNVSYKLDAGLIRNMADVNTISQTMADINGDRSYVDPVAGLSLNASALSGPFDASINYVTALRSFNGADLPSYIDADRGQDGAKPSAWGIDVGYSFATLGHQSRFGLGYQGSKEAYQGAAVKVDGVAGDAIFALPKQRYIADYSVNVSKYTDLGFQVYHDRRAGDNATVGVVRLGVKFA